MPFNIYTVTVNCVLLQAGNTICIKPVGHYNALEAERDKRLHKSRELDAFMAMLAKQPLVVSEWDERLWVTLLDRATVYRDGRIAFRVKSGKEITA